MTTQIKVYKRYSDSPGNTEIIEGQNTSDDTVAIEVGLAGITGLGEVHPFRCPWCDKTYSARRSERNLILNCVKCGKQMMAVVEEGDGNVEYDLQPLPSREITPHASPMPTATTLAGNEPVQRQYQDAQGVVVNNALAVWIAALALPSVSTFLSILRDTEPSTGSAIIWMFLSGLLSGLAAIFSLVPRALGTYGVTYNIPLVALAAIVVASAQVVCFTIYALLTHAVAKMFGGRQRDYELAYTMAAYLAPLSLFSGMIIHIPGLQWILPLLLIYSIVLYVMAVKATCGFGWGSTIASCTIALATSATIIVILGAILIGALIAREIGVSF